MSRRTHGIDYIHDRTHLLLIITDNRHFKNRILLRKFFMMNRTLSNQTGDKAFQRTALSAAVNRIITVCQKGCFVIYQDLKSLLQFILFDTSLIKTLTALHDMCAVIDDKRLYDMQLFNKIRHNMPVSSGYKSYVQISFLKNLFDISVHDLIIIKQSPVQIGENQPNLI